MSHGVEHCPTCLVVPMRQFTNGWGGAFLTCLDCGYSDPIRRQADPFPSEIVPSVRGVRYKKQHLGVNTTSRVAVPRGAKRRATKSPSTRRVA